MKPNDPLDSLLETWQPAPSVPANFHEAVWTHIAAQAGDARAGKPDIVAANFARRRAWMAAAAAVVLGFAMGLLAPQNPSPSDSTREAYFARINPLTAQP